MIDNPYTSSATSINSDPANESIFAAAQYGAKRGALIAGIFPLGLGLIQMGVLAYYSVVDPVIANRVLDARNFVGVVIEIVQLTCGTAMIGASCGAALLGARARARKKQAQQVRPHG